MRKIWWLACISLLIELSLTPATASAQDRYIDFGPVIIAVDPSEKIDPGVVRTGYVVITPVPFPGSSKSLSAIGTIVQRGDTRNIRTSFAAPGLLTSASMTIDVNDRLGSNLGVGIVNPSDAPASVTLTVRGSDGTPRGGRTVLVAARQQLLDFVTNLVPVAGAPYMGTLAIDSTIPISITGIQLRESTFSSVPLSSLGTTSDLAAISSGVGGPGSVLLPLFVEGGGWASKILLSNPESSVSVVRLDFFTGEGKPMTATLNGFTGSRYINLAVSGGGIFLLAPRDIEGNDAF